MESSLRVVWACCKKALKSALTEHLSVFPSGVLPINCLLLMCIMTLSGSNVPEIGALTRRKEYQNHESSVLVWSQ